MNEQFPSLIILVDDDPDDRLLFKDAIGEINMNIAVHTLEGGVELMNYLKEKTNPLPDFIFLDLNMPRKNGFECLEEIRNEERFSNLCVIIYSTSTHFKDILDTLNKGANLYFTKPYSFQELVGRLGKIFNLNWEEFKPQPNLNNYVLSDGMGY